MAYEKTRKKMEAYGLSDADIREIVDTYADELTEQEPYAVNAIATARSLAEEFATEE